MIAKVIDGVVAWRLVMVNAKSLKDASGDLPGFTASVLCVC